MNFATRPFHKSSYDDLIELLTEITQLPEYWIKMRMKEYLRCYSEHNSEIITICKEIDADWDSLGKFNPFSEEDTNAELIDEIFDIQYIEDTLKIIRMYTNVNIKLCDNYYYGNSFNTPLIFFNWSTLPIQTPQKKDIDHSLSQKLQKKINTGLSICDLSVKTALKYLELSFDLETEETENDIAFITAMTGLESLFSIDQEIRYRLAHHTAVLLGKNQESSKDIFKDIKKLYDYRSKIVHGGKQLKISLEDLHRLRQYLCDAIITLNNTGLKRDEYNSMLDRLGFGDFTLYRINQYKKRIKQESPPRKGKADG